MPINSKQKGKRFELEIAHKLQALGYDAIRSVQYCGSNGDADVIGLPNIHIECKAVEKLNLYDAMAQAHADARSGEIPIVIHKKNYKPVLVTMDFNDWIELYKGWSDGRVR